MSKQLMKMLSFVAPLALVSSCADGEALVLDEPSLCDPPILQPVPLDVARLWVKDRKSFEPFVTKLEITEQECFK